MKFKFGLRELFFVIIGVAINTYLGNLDISREVNSYRAIQPEHIVTAFFAMMGGPIVGSLIGLLGYIMARLAFHHIYFWSWAAASIVIGLGVGMNADRYYLPDGDFEGMKIIMFNMIQIMSNGCAFLLVYPLLEVLLYEVPIAISLQNGIRVFMVNSLILGAGATVIGLIYSRLVNARKKYQEARK